VISRVLLAGLVLTLGCASSTPQTAAAPETAADCGGKYAVTVRNEGNTVNAAVYYSDAKLMKPAALLGSVLPNDQRTYYFRSVEAPAAWAQIGSIRIFPNDRSTQQRLRVRIALECDAG